MADLMADIAETADELTNPIRSVERLQDRDGNRHILGRRGRAPRREWVVVLPCLLEQLHHAVIPGETYDEQEHARQPPGSRPAARLDAVACLLRIDAGVTIWANHLDMVWRQNTASTIRGLVGNAGVLHSDQQTNLLSHMTAWRSWAAVTAGWERPPDAPRGTCPACSALNTIRVRLAEKRAICVACGAWWDHETIGVLAAHITAPSTTVDTSVLRSNAVLARREWEARRAALAGRHRPDLPYMCQRCGKTHLGPALAECPNLAQDRARTTAPRPR